MDSLVPVDPLFKSSSTAIFLLKNTGIQTNIGSSVGNPLVQVEGKRLILEIKCGGNSFSLIVSLAVAIKTFVHWEW